MYIEKGQLLFIVWGAEFIGSLSWVPKMKIMEILY